MRPNRPGELLFEAPDRSVVVDELGGTPCIEQAGNTHRWKQTPSGILWSNAVRGKVPESVYALRVVVVVAETRFRGPTGAARNIADRAALLPASKRLVVDLHHSALRALAERPATSISNRQVAAAA